MDAGSIDGNWTRRRVVAALGVAPAGAALGGVARSPGRSPALPRLASRTFDIRRFGAGAEAATAAIDRAIRACAAAGGGRVVIPAGRFRTGAIRLLSGVELHLMRGATLAFSTDPHDYPLAPTWWEGVELMNHAPLIGAWDAHDVAITGDGLLDGGASAANWWSWSGGERFGWRPGLPNQRADRDALFAMAEAGVPPRQRVFGAGHHLRPSFVEFQRCRRVLVEGVTVRDSPCWSIHPVLCRDVTVRRVTVRGHGPNTDGCDPESVERMLIEGCRFDTGDDCIAIKAGRDADGRRLAAPTRGVVIRDCHMAAGHGGVTVGSEMTGGVHDVVVERCTMSSPDLWYALRIKSNTRRGGVISGIRVRDVRVGRVAKAAIGCDFAYEGGVGPYPPQLSDVTVERMIVADAPRVLELRGTAAAPVAGLSLIDCRFDGVRDASVFEHAAPVTVRGLRINGRPAASP